eukprot:4471925-Pleurochrysis_carterae.AAC.3
MAAHRDQRAGRVSTYKGCQVPVADSQRSTPTGCAEMTEIAEAEKLALTSIETRKLEPRGRHLSTPLERSGAPRRRRRRSPALSPRIADQPSGTREKRARCAATPSPERATSLHSALRSCHPGRRSHPRARAAIAVAGHFRAISFPRNASPSRRPLHPPQLRCDVWVIDSGTSAWRLAGEEAARRGVDAQPVSAVRMSDVIVEAKQRRPLRTHVGRRRGAARRACHCWLRIYPEAVVIRPGSHIAKHEVVRVGDPESRGCLVGVEE